MNHTIPSDLAALAKVFIQTSEALTQANKTAKFVELNAAKTPTGRFTKASAFLVNAAQHKQVEALEADNVAEKAFQEAYWAWDLATFGQSRIAEARAKITASIGNITVGSLIDITDEYAARYKVVSIERGWKEESNYYGKNSFVLNVTPQGALRSIKSVERVYATEENGGDYQGNRTVEVEWETHLRFSLDENGFFRASELYYGSRSTSKASVATQSLVAGRLALITNWAVACRPSTEHRLKLERGLQSSHRPLTSQRHWHR